MGISKDRHQVVTVKELNQEWKLGAQTTPQHQPRKARDNIPSSSKVGMKQFNKTP